MSKKSSTRLRRVSSILRRRRIGVSVAVLCLVGTLSLGMVAGPWRNSLAARKLRAAIASPLPAPALPAPGNPSKQYIYAGGKLIATEEPGSGPTVSLTSPANNFTLNAGTNLPIAISAAVTGGTISQVQVYQGTTLLGTATAAGGSVYNYTWNTVAAGTYALTAKATAGNGAVTTSGAVTVISNALPTVSLTSPANNFTFAAGTNLAIRATSGDTDGTISQVQIFRGSTLLGTATAAGGGVYNYTWNQVPAGTHSLTAKATDNRGAVTTSGAINVTATSSLASHSLSVNGTTAYAEVANSTSLNITGPITVEAWIRVNAIGSHQDIVSRINKNDASSGGGYAISVNAAGKVRFDVHQSNTQYITTTGATTISAGVWYHLAGVFTGSQQRLYLNGVLDGSLTTANGPASSTTPMLRIGRGAYASNAAPLFMPPHYFGGLIDEVRVSAAAIYTSNFTPAKSLSPASGTRGWWKFDNQSPADSSGSNNTCSFQGGAIYSTVVP
jgi:hypothetical protein